MLSFSKLRKCHTKCLGSEFVVIKRTVTNVNENVLDIDANDLRGRPNKQIDFGFSHFLAVEKILNASTRTKVDGHIGNNTPHLKPIACWATVAYLDLNPVNSKPSRQM